MKYKNIQGIEKKASRFVYGLGNDRVTGDDYSLAKQCIDDAFECGFTVFDTANCYGKSEENFGRWLYQTGNREKVIILDKGCNPGMKGSNDVFAPQTIRCQVEESLRRLKTDYLDMYILHRDDKTKSVGPIVEVLNELKNEGKIKKFGGSNWHYTRVAETLEYAKAHGLEGFSVASPCYNMVKLIGDPWGGSEHICGAEKEPDRKWYRENGIVIFPYSSLARGYLSGKYKAYGEKKIEDVLWWGPIEEYHYPENEEKLKRALELAKKKGCSVSQLALSWFFRQESEIYPIISPGSKSHMIENIGAFDVEITEEDMRWLG